MTEKYCSHCKQMLDTDSFTKDRSKKDGLRAMCRDCYNSYLGKRRGSWPSRSKEAKRQEWAQYIRKHNGDPTKKDRDARYRASNPDKIQIRAKTYNSSRVPGACAVDGCHGVAERHHLSYADADDFVWLCKDHHLEAHRA